MSVPKKEKKDNIDSEELEYKKKDSIWGCIVKWAEVDIIEAFIFEVG